MIMTMLALAIATAAEQSKEPVALVGGNITVMDNATGSGMRQVPAASLQGPFYLIDGDPSGTMVQLQSSNNQFWTMATSVIRGKARASAPVLSPCRKDQVGATRGSCGSAKPR